MMGVEIIRIKADLELELVNGTELGNMKVRITTGQMGLDSVELGDISIR